MKAICLNCGEEFVGRSDKKFCCDQCRNTYNNQIKREHEILITNINKILRKNRKILKQFNPEGKTVIRKEHLLKLGFDFNYHTHSRTTPSQNTYYFCYEYGYMFLKDEKILIINQQKYMKPSTP